MTNWILLAFVLASTQAKHLSLPLTRHASNEDVLGRRDSSRLTRYTIVPEKLAKNTFWSAKFDVGDSKGLELVVDTGSNLVYLNPDVYKPSSESIHLRSKNATGSYIGTRPNGCGFLSDYRVDVYKDTVSIQGLAAKNQPLVDSLKSKSTYPGVETQLPPPWNGILGFGGYDRLTDLGLPFFENLCHQNQVDECRFGVAFGTSGKGKQILGGVDKTLIEGKLSSPAKVDRAEWFIKGALASNGSVTTHNLTILLDTGTPNVEGPLEDVRSLFEQHRIQAVEHTRAACGGKILYGYYPCDATPQIGFKIGNTVLDIEPASFALAKKRNNCTSTIIGYSYAGSWVAGQAWMQGKYLDFNTGGDLHSANKKFVRAAKLKDPVRVT